MNVLIFTAVIWAICKLISAASRGAKERAAERERERIRQEQERIREEQARARAWQREQEQRAREAARRQVEHDKAIARAAREREALRKEQERQAKEQARQAAEIAKHEAELDRMRHVLAQATADIDFLQERSAELYAQLDNVLLLQAGTVPGSSAHTKYQSKIVTLHNQIHAAETKLSRAQYQREQANKKLSA